MIQILTEEQERMLVEYRDKMFFRAVSTVTNRTKAEKWALELTKGIYDKAPEIIWCSSPWKAKMEFGSLIDHPRDDIRDRLMYSITGSLSDDLKGSIIGRIRASLLVNLRGNFVHSHENRLWASLWSSICDSYCDSILCTGWITYYSFAKKAGLVRYDEEDSRKLKCYRKLLKHCFAIYAVRGKIILVDKPTATKVAGGILVDIKF